MRRELSSVLAALTVVVTMAACEKKEENTTLTTDTASAAPAAPAPAATEASTGAAPAGGGQLPAGVTADMVASGNTIFHGPGNCYTCHGADAKGTPLAPDLTDSQWLNIDGSYDQIVQVITTGVPTPKDKSHPGPMPPKGGSQATDEQVKQVAAYVYSLSHGGTP
jgi:mono/diheme cytochrome c family protein